MFRIYNKDNMKVLPRLKDNSIDSIVTDPPYGIRFMGKKWDHDVPTVDVWQECLRVLKPGGYLLCFAGTRTHHRMCVNIEDAGFEIRDMIAWVYGSGFPKSHNIGKAIDKMVGVEREVIAPDPESKRRNKGAMLSEEKGRNANSMGNGRLCTITAPATESAKKYEGWGTALKPAMEIVTVARKPFKGTVAANVLKWGTGGINIEECRVEGRFPANLIHDGSDEVVGLFPETSGGKPRTGVKGGSGFGYFDDEKTAKTVRTWHGGSGSASRFFYCAKASKKDRNEGLEGFEDKQYSYDGRDKPIENAFQRNKSVAKNNHPTVKPTDLMRYLCRLVTPKGGIVFDPFMGSGSTGKACGLGGFSFIGCDNDKEHGYFEIAKERIKKAYENQ